MTYRKILRWNDSRLRKEVMRVQENEKEAVKTDLVDTLKIESCKYLSAPQIGILKKVMIIDHAVVGDDNFFGPICLYNPTLFLFGQEENFLQTCSSIPYFSSLVKRFNSCALGGETDQGIVEFSFSGNVSADIQLVFDFFSGVSLLSRVSNLKKKMYLRRVAKKIMKKKRDLADVKDSDNVQKRKTMVRNRKKRKRK